MIVISLRKPIIRFDNLFSYDTIYGFSQGWTKSGNGGYDLCIPSEITLTVVFTEEPVKLLKYAMIGYMFDKVVLDHGEGRTLEFESVIINSVNDRFTVINNSYTVNMLALRVRIFVSEEERKGFEAMALITKGELYIGVKK